LTKFDRAQLLTFLRSVDRHLPSPTSVVVVGGAAAIIGYRSTVRTSDVDVFVGLTDEFIEAGRQAQEETGLAIAIEKAAIAEIPYNYEDRVRAVKIPRLAKLTVIVPDRYDLALSKAIRCWEHDLDAIEAIHRRQPLVLRTLVQRFESELMNIALAAPARNCLNVVIVVGRLFGAAEARSLAQHWGVPTPTKK
jgi:hypothetical protein